MRASSQSTHGPTLACPPIRYCGISAWGRVRVRVRVRARVRVKVRVRVSGLVQVACR